MTIGVVVGAGGGDEAGGIVDDGGGERVGFGIVDHAQIDRRSLPTIDLGVVNNPKPYCMYCGRGTGFRSVEFREFIPSG